MILHYLSLRDQLVGLREAIFGYLSSLDPLVAIVDDRIYAVEPDEGDAPKPYLTYEFHRAKAGSSGGHGLGRRYGRNLYGLDGTSTANVSFVATSNLESECIRIIRCLSALEGFSGVMGGVQILYSSIEVEFDAAVKPPKGSTQWIHQAGVIYRIVHRATPATA